ncbi:MAG: GWxTD domain-containing protein [Acidobacteria bacterium]|nr:GWxTD domain-containing protein [Acidobacteriota bacterium]MCA1609825.1 GWxTD domain-containing protein [Acidobacteriota bacterium]
MKKMILASIFASLFAGFLSAQSVVELFQKAKQQVKAASYTDALTTLDALDAETAKEGHESERRMAEGPLAFLRGVCDAALGKGEEARAEFQTYLTFVPNASIDASMYPKKAVVAFEDARKSLASGAKRAPAEMASLANSYARFRGTTPAAPENLNETWGNGPVRFLMTAEEKIEWSRLSDPVSRSEFVTKFWTSRDLRPETPDNEFRQEFETRVAFADANFSQDEVRGSLTDRGMVFVLVGPPTWVGRKPIRTGEDTADAAGMSTSTRNDVTTATAGAGRNQAAIADRMTGPGTRILDSAANWREVWHYRRELLPAAIPYHQVDFDFITRKGYGKNVLQRDAITLSTLEAARRARTGGRPS